jgi:hypothetical protein
MSTRDLPHATPSLFDAPLATPIRDVLEPSWNEKGLEKLAKDFVRWCFSFGGEFRNSPDITNLRYWLQKTKSKIAESDELQILEIARPLFFKRIDQLTRKPEPSN